MKFAAGIIAAVAAIELTADEWAEATAGKTVFAKFYAPWCGHCKSMKAAWEEVEALYADGVAGVVASVDCTEDANQELCESIGVEGFPTVKYGAADDLQDYEGGRDLEELLAFAKENLKPMCGPSNLDLCDDDKKADIQALQAMAIDALEAKVEDGTSSMKAAETELETVIEGLQAAYEKALEEKEEKIKAIKTSGHGLASAVLTQRRKESASEL